jgi:hypothetical protein
VKAATAALAVAAHSVPPGLAAQSARARAPPSSAPATVGVAAPRPTAATPPRTSNRSPTARDAYPRLLPGARSPNVAHRANVGPPGAYRPIGTTIASLPGAHTRVRHGAAWYYYCLGTFYSRSAAGYEVVAAPVGATVNSLPAGAEAIEIGGRLLHYYDGEFYAAGRRAGTYVTVAAPEGAIVGHLPHDAVEVVVRDLVYFRARGVFYLAVRRDGLTEYVVSSP